MPLPDPQIPKNEFSNRLQKLMFLRVLFVSLLLGASVVIQVRQTRTYFGDIQTSHYLLIAVIYFLTFIYIELLKRFNDLKTQAYIQLLTDAVLVTAIIYATGGIKSIFSFLYILTIINASILLYRRGGMILASCSSILYGLLLDLHYYNVIDPLGDRLSYSAGYGGAYILYIIVVNIAAFYLVAFLSSYPAEQARKSSVELKSRQDDIIKLEALNELIIKSITSGLVTVDEQKRVILFNPAAANIFGIKADQAIGRVVEDIFPFLEGKLERIPSGGLGRADLKHPFIDLPLQAPEGPERYIRLSVSPLSLPGIGQRGRILSFQDITELKEIEEEIKKVEGLAMVGELAAGIAHEIRNPMASISGSIQMLREDLAEDGENSRLMDIILREISRLNHLVNDFLLFARPKKPSFRPVNLNRLIADSLELVKKSGSWPEGIQVRTEFNGPESFQTDPEHLQQILWNLFRNAGEAMPGGGTLFIRTDRVGLDVPVEGEEMVKITVRDTGCGFQEKAISQLFTPFFTTKEGGTGLGLATVKRIMEGLGGRIYGYNHAGGGAELVLFLQGGSLIER